MSEFPSRVGDVQPNTSTGLVQGHAVKLSIVHAAVMDSYIHPRRSGALRYPYARVCRRACLAAGAAALKRIADLRASSKP